MKQKKIMTLLLCTLMFFTALPAGASGSVSVSRAQAVDALWKLNGQPVVNYIMTFDDVDEGSQYCEAIRWASSEKLVLGCGDGSFDTDAGLTLEQLAVILYRYAIHEGMDVSVGEDTNILSYDDFGEISDYAFPALQWACGSGLIKSEGTVLGPKAPVSMETVLEMIAGMYNN